MGNGKGPKQQQEQPVSQTSLPSDGAYLPGEAGVQDARVRGAVAAARGLAAELAEGDDDGFSTVTASLLRTLADVCEAGERRWARLLFDLHDGPLQEVDSLILDAGFLHRAVERALAEDPRRDELVGLAEQFATRLDELDAELREISASVIASGLQSRPLLDALAAMVDEFQRATGIPVAYESSGDVPSLTLSQKIALFRVSQGALANIRRHAGATAVSLSLHMDERQTVLRIEDDGRGFDVEAAFAAAAARRRIGLTAMRERVRLLGGRFELESREGGPTVLTATLRRWGGTSGVDESSKA